MPFFLWKTNINMGKDFEQIKTSSTQNKSNPISRAENQLPEV